MIKNEREYRITKSQAESFARALDQLSTSKGKEAEALVAIQRAALKSQLDDLKDQLVEYEGLRDGRRKVLQLTSFEEIPLALIQARIAAGLTQKDLADRIGVAPQQIQRYEANDYASASLARLQDIAKALGVTMREDIFLGHAKVSMDGLKKRVRDAGIDPAFLSRRISDEDPPREGSDDAATAVRVGSVLKRIFGWDPVDIFAGPSQLQVPTFAGAPRYKLPASAQEARTQVLTAYARYVAGLAVKATPQPEASQIPTDAAQVRAKLASRGELCLRVLLGYLWEHGVPVVPLDEGGGFHGAFWRIGGRSVIVLKQRTSSEARWMHDLLHETYHAACHGDEPDLEVLDGEEGPTGAVAAEEKRATRFAGNVLLDGKAEALAKECVKEASGRLQYLKRAVPTVAKRRGVRADVLANYMAFRLALQGEDWWGAANNLQPTGEHPWRTARDFLLERLSIQALDAAERDLLRLALVEENDSAG